MPQIIGYEEQKLALKEIRTILKEMESTNQFLEKTNSEGYYSILFTADDDTKCSAVAFSEDKKTIDQFILHRKHMLANHVQKLTEEHRIRLSPAEKRKFGVTPSQTTNISRSVWMIQKGEGVPRV